MGSLAIPSIDSNLCSWARAVATTQHNFAPRRNFTGEKNPGANQEVWTAPGLGRTDRVHRKVPILLVKSVNDPCTLVAIVLCEPGITSVIDELINSKMIHPSLPHNNRRVTTNLIAFRPPVEVLDGIKDSY